jgi:formylglycine-generating enzyme required for sulfatase activity
MKPNDPNSQDPTAGSEDARSQPAFPNIHDPSATDDSRSTYEILRLIGHGAYGEVYLARDASGTFRAVKVIFRESFDDERPFEREYEGICKFERVTRSYDDQVQVFHVGRRENPRQFYYIMELADDQLTGQEIQPKTYVPKTLHSELKARGRIPAKECLRIGATLAHALENLHDGGLIHRDIKPANIIFVKGRPKLADIGLVTDRDVAKSFVGTEGYIPPEGPGSIQSDIYSLGKVLYEMATGRNRLEYPELPTDLAEFPDREIFLELNEVICKACESIPDKRYRSTAQLLADLNQLQQGHSLKQRRRLKRGLIVVGLAMGMMLLLAAGTFGLWRGRLTQEVEKSNPVNMVWIAAGTFTMGSPANEEGRGMDEGPQTTVTISHGYWMGKYEVTQGEYQAVMGSNPSYFRNDALLPVDQVTWHEATNYCGKLTEQELKAGRLPRGFVYRLPTEAEWEYAYRAGTTTRFHWGDDLNFNQLGDYAWYVDNSHGRSYPVGVKTANPWGLHDMGGNVLEWCKDWYSGALRGGSVANPQGPQSGSLRVVRGGSWYDSARDSRAAARGNRPPDAGGIDFGFRPVLAPDQTGK